MRGMGTNRVWVLAVLLLGCGGALPSSPDGDGAACYAPVLVPNGEGDAVVFRAQGDPHLWACAHGAKVCARRNAAVAEYLCCSLECDWADSSESLRVE